MFQVTSSWKESVTFSRVLERNIDIIRITKISGEYFCKTGLFYKCKTWYQFLQYGLVKSPTKC